MSLALQGVWNEILTVRMMNNNSSVFHDCICYMMNILSCGIKVVFQRFDVQNGGSTRIVTAQKCMYLHYLSKRGETYHCIR